jgi:hypothetical protein
MAKPRKPSPAHISRAGRDMHSKNPRVRREAAEVMATLPRRKPKPKKR